MNYFPEVFAVGMGSVCLGGCARRGLGLASASIPGVYDLSGGGGRGDCLAQEQKPSPS